MKKFITFEGCEGVGKSTQLNLLKEYLASTNQKAIFTREPGGTPLAEKIRKLILTEDMSSETEALLFASARSEHIDNLILPALNDGYIVVCDRFIDSSLAYQGFARDLGVQQVLDFNRYAVENCMPSATIFLNQDPANSWRKQSGVVIENDRLELESTDFHSKVYKGFCTLAENYDRFINIIPQQDMNVTSQNIIRSLQERGLIK